jgi:glycosyltransferase involved in cell wall biosynthesis
MRDIVFITNLLCESIFGVILIMHILLVNNTSIPVRTYGGTERVIWWLGKQLVQMGHQVSYLVAPGSSCAFATGVHVLDHSIPFNEQIPEGVDVVHLNCNVNEPPNIPYIFTLHGNTNDQNPLDINTVFVSKNHASRYGSTSFVHNGIDPEDYGDPGLNQARNYFHFLGDAAWRVKNVRGAIKIAQIAKIQLRVIGGKRFNLNQGIRLTFDPRIRFDGMQGGIAKNNLLKGSKGLIFPVLWNEPFGLSIVESIYFGCPAFGTPYGSLQEIIQQEVGFVSNSISALVDAVKNADQFDQKKCHEYVMAHFTSTQMANNYLTKYEQVLNGQVLNDSAPQLTTFQQDKFLPFLP